MSRVWPDDKRNFAAVLCGDLHFSHDPPVARAEGRAAWYQAQAGYIDQLTRVAAGKPIFVAGDVLHKWNSHPQLVNFLLDQLTGRRLRTVPGNHDLPEHSIKDMERSSYWTLVFAKAILPLGSSPDIVQTEPGGRPATMAWGFGCGQKLRPCNVRGHNPVPRLAVVHAYAHTSPANGFPGAPPESRVCELAKSLDGYDVVLSGDNHKTFLCHDPSDGLGEDTSIKTWLNAGTFMRRRSDERDHRPCVGLMYTSGLVIPHYLDVSKDVWREDFEAGAADMRAAGLDPDAFLELVRNLGDTKLDFRAALADYLRRHEKVISAAAVKLVERIVGEACP